MIGFVYAIACEDRVKIGWSADPLRRLTKLQSDCPGPASLVGLIQATKTQEAEVHQILSAWRLSGEWFDRTAWPVASFVNMLPKAHPKPVKTNAGLEPAASLIHRLGGEAAISSLLGVAYTAPYRWQSAREKGGTDGLIPQKYHLVLLEYARHHNLDLKAEDFLPRVRQDAA